MNKQLKLNKDGSVKSRGIEWCNYTWNPLGGCLHGCEWRMPDGSIAVCYAKDVAEKVAEAAYPNGFASHYWHPELLQQPVHLKTPSKIFWGSMTDNFGHWIPGEQLDACMTAIKAAPQHVFQALTKNPKRMANYALADANRADNIWWGASSPPDFMWNKPLNRNQQEALLDTTLFNLSLIHKTGAITWMSAEPLSWDISHILREFYETGNQPLDWIVIGAASNGNKYYPPAEAHVKNLVATAKFYGIKIFYKGNLRSLPWAATNWMEEFPDERR